MRLARFARVRLLRHALPISLLILRKKPTVLQSTTIQALQAKAEEAMGKDSSQREKSEYENESDSEDEYSNERSGRDDNCAGNADENDVSTSECISTRHVLFYNQTTKSNTIGGENAEKHIVNFFKPQLLEMKLNWIHIITSSKCV